MKLRYIFYSLIINIIMVGIFYLTIMKPIEVISKLVAKGLCESWKLNCEFKNEN